MDITKLKKIHIIGIGGIGISAVAKLLLNQDKIVTGSDLNDSDIIGTLKNFGAKIKIGPHKAENVTKDINLVIYTDAVPEDNPERVQAKKLKIENLSYFQFLGQFSKDKYTIAISGCHGKTTTTALTGLILENGNFDPTVIVGSKVSNWDGNLRLGSSEYFVVEGDEYRAHMMELSPKAIILNNLEFDHPDFYRDLTHYIDTFQDFVNKLPEDGHLIYNRDDKNIKERLEIPNCHIATFGLDDPSADLIVKNIKIEHGRQIFKPVYKGQELRDFNLQIPGKFNILNALGASLMALELGVSPDVVKNTLAQYTGAWRRFEIIGKISDLTPDKNGALVISDYAHHPTEVAKTIQAAKEFYPDKRLLVVFQPHQIQRTKSLFDDFIKAFAQSPADVVILSEIYDVAGREEKDVTKRVSSNDLLDKIILTESKKLIAGVKPSLYYFASDLTETKAKILSEVQSNDVVLILGAGDIDKVARELV
ncbi:MAG: UDP-N-acetylmuramate--L-alanine ligase [Candidatus Buchananbacteria bacterium RBG_13_36_9]|uniref:UDP-N-acetylmuramate--L-alanine ligase n=1 Tax=Candidatus Buchananbacteria bacterium RBG_13_36_9 TaxID=1797530 RepID=A0A1G1XPA0_9BACT|nr:MAG: UDP-N-acetylmuramate--L-alanine ligase [Candidatus Buchananbacteria bacterium RBG_13_36_9]